MTKQADKILDLLDDDILAHKTKIPQFAAAINTLRAWTKDQEPGDVNVTMAFTHAKNLASSILNILAPSNRMYGSVESSVASQTVANGVATLLNKHSRDFKHRKNFLSIIFDGICYNRGVGVVRYNTVIKNTGVETPQEDDLLATSTYKVVKEGTSIQRLQTWNCILDSEYKGDDYALEARHFTYVERVTMHELRARVANGEIALTKSQLDKVGTVSDSLFTKTPETYFSKKDHSCRDEARGLTKFLEIATEATNDYSDIELLTTYIWGTEADLGISKKAKEYSLYKVVILNNTDVVNIGKFTDTDGTLPIILSVPENFIDGTDSPSIVNSIRPVQEMLNKFTNMHAGSLEANNYHGLTFLSHLFPEIDETKIQSGTFRVGKLPEGQTMRDHVLNIPTNVPSNSALEGANFATALLGQMLPTNSADRLANLSRPVTHQSQNLVAEATLPILTMARDAHAALTLPAISMQVTMLTKRNTVITVLGDGGKEESIALDEYTDVADTLSITDGLRGLDTVAMSAQLQTLFQYMLQNAEIASNYDMMAFASYILQIGGSNIDLNSFRKTSQFDQLTLDQKNAAMQLLEEYTASQQQPQPQPHTAPSLKSLMEG